MAGEGRNRDGILLAGRVLLAAALLPPGIARALNPSGFALTLASVGMPAPHAVATGSVIVTIFGPLALALGVLPRLTGWTLAAHTLVMGLLLHRFWDFTGASALIERELFLAQAGLAGGLLLAAAAGPGAWSWEGWRQGARTAPPPAPAARKRAAPRPKAARAAA
ncbi:DoxX family protein [Methylobacterium sp. 4-46]|uniref:DoxX family protein n=1 Tax=unclassified Methylobacterium TaxID=2615210 RepID=UPI000152E50A|nr:MULTISPECIES: DoxX family protein [Methylobacterium]ACA16598.1 DoxX family protein [Methylobacterium sp. 4-46]WFT82302.1 DoxX family protein [Methylobacterium nodulans]